MRYFFLFITLLFINCNPKKIDNKKNSTEDTKQKEREFSLDYAVKAFAKIHPENNQIISTFKDCIRDGNLNDYYYHWKESDTLIFKYPYDDLFLSIEDYYPTYKPTILAIQKLKTNKYLIKIAIMGSPEDFNSLAIIYNFYAVKDEDGIFKFENVITDNLKDWQNLTYKNIHYILPKNKKINLKEVEKQLNFEDKLISKFNFDKINYTYVSSNSVNEFMKIRGFDYEDSMFFNNQKGGSALPSHKLIFSGNNSEFYPHELVHLYTYKYFKNINPTINEGLATYLGGSKELDYKEHIKILKEYVNANNINLFDYTFDDNKKHTILKDTSSIQYAVGALLCALADEQGKLKILLNSGKSDKELILTIQEIFNIPEDKIDSFLKDSLKKYN